MTDPRYLVPETSLPFFPLGVPPVWLDDQGQPTTWPTLHSVAYLDLSAPPERDGIPAYLDPLPWALIVLGKRIGVKLLTHADYQIHPREGEWCAWAWGRSCPPCRIPVATFAEVRPTDDIDADRRAVVAHALRNHVQKEPTP